MPEGQLNQAEDGLLPATTKPGPIWLRVADLERQLAYYQAALGLQVLARRPDNASLGTATGRVLVHLCQLREVSPRPARSSGLYHFALLLPSRPDLAQALVRLLEANVPLQGAADHHVSEAIYLADPEGNGIEIYADRQMDEWRDRQGDLIIVTDPLDLAGLMSDLKGKGPAEAIPDGTVMGHIHLHVGDLAGAEAFYRDIVGFDLMARYGASASFLSAGGYHHHLGINIWAGEGAPPAGPQTPGMEHFSLMLPSRATAEQLAGRVQDAGRVAELQEDGWLIEDPSENRLLVVVEDTYTSYPSPAPA
jgi:catechol 2,3-dioxygenase